MNLANLDDLFNQVVVEHPKSELKTRSSSREASKEYQVATFERLQEKVARVSQSFHDHGLRKGDKVAIVGKPSTRWVIAFFAAQRLGAIVVPLAADLTSQEIRRILQESRSKFAVLDPGGQRKLLTVTDLLSNLELIAVYGTEAENDFLSWENLLYRGQYSGSAYSDSDDTAVLMYTSGTMGDAKGVMLSHRNLLTNVADLCDILNLGSGDTVASILPWFHIYGLTTGLLTPLAIGASTIFTDNYRQLPSVLKENGATILLGVPKLYNVLYRELKAKVHSSWITRAISRYLPEVLKWKIKRELAGSQFRFAVSGGAPLDPKVAQGLKDLGIGIYEGYGLTETSPVLTWTEDPHKDNQGSVGTPLPSVQLKIDSPDDSGAGEVLVKGPVVMQGYYKNPEKTDEA
ncbi:MAG: AMP-binding protein, partial [Candidatus Bipolaricaulota bacterium]